MEKVNFSTEDDVKIVGDFYPGKNLKAVVLLHMMPATRESWKGFASKAKEYWNLLAIDLRGHGESVRKGNNALDYRAFSDLDHQGSLKDIKAAISYLKDERGVTAFALVGASIGSNLALWYQSLSSDIKKSVLLSPGFNYRGIETMPLVNKISQSQAVYYIGGSKDTRGSGYVAGEVVRSLYNSTNTPNKEVEIPDTHEHGTNMFSYDPDLITRVINWLKS